MTQGLQLSSLLGNTDTALLSGSGAVGIAAEGNGADTDAAFSQVLADVSQAATSGQPKLTARKLPAAISSLSDISKALLAATEPGVEHTEADDALSANLLQQIAFSEQAKPTRNNVSALTADAVLAKAEEAGTIATVADENGPNDSEADLQLPPLAKQNNAQLAAQSETKNIAKSDAKSTATPAVDSAVLTGKVTSALLSEQTVAAADTAVSVNAGQDGTPTQPQVSDKLAKDVISAVDVKTANDITTAKGATADSQSKTMTTKAKVSLPVDDTLARSEGKAVLADAMAKQQAEPGAVASEKVTASKTLATPVLQDTRIASQLRQELEPAKQTPEKAETTRSNRFSYEPDAERLVTEFNTVEDSAKGTIAKQTESGAALRQWLGGHQTKADNAKLPVMPPETDSVQADTIAQQTLLQETRIISEMAPSEPGTYTTPAESNASQDSLITTAKSTVSNGETSNLAATRDLISTGALQANAATDDAAPVQATRTADSASQAKVGDERSASTTAADKTSTLKTDTGSGKSGSEQSASQQQQQPGQFTEPAANTLQHKVTEAAGIERGVFNAETLTGRVESVFGQSAQAGIGAVAAKAATSQVSVAEQLKQRLNLQHQDAAGQLRERVNLMLRQNIQVAEIRLDPVGLGQMQIKVDMQQDQAQVQFVVQQPQAKELLEQQMPRLREMLQQQGITLSEGNVQQQSQSQQQERQLAQQDSDGRRQNHQQAANTDEHGTEQGSTVQLKVPVSDRMVDYYA